MYNMVKSLQIFRIVASLRTLVPRFALCLPVCHNFMEATLPTLVKSNRDQVSKAN